LLEPSTNSQGMTTVVFLLSTHGLRYYKELRNRAETQSLSVKPSLLFQVDTRRELWSR
jgi:hypothetical protein